ncbi:MAG: hypothetical protein ACREMW_00725 [Gemmatimonadales bacterium]
MRLVPFLALVAAAMLARPIRLAAQAVERTDTPRRGALRVSFDPRIEAWEQVYTPGGRKGLGAGFGGDSVSQALPSVVRLQQDVRAATGLAGYLATLGHELLAVRAERRVMPIRFEYGVTSRLSFGVTIPIVRVQVRELFQARPPGSNLGALSHLAADSARYTTFFNHLDAALAQLGDSIAAGAYGCPAGPDCLRAQALLAQGQSLRVALGRAVYGVPDSAALYLPLAGSDAGLGITAIVTALERALVDTFRVTPFSQETFLLPGIPVHGAAASGLLANRLSANGLAPFRDTRRRLRFFPGDIELATTYRLLAGRDYAAAATLVVRLPTGHQDSPNDLFDVATGDHQIDLEGRLTQEVTIGGRLWLNVSLRGGRQLAGERERRVGAADQLLLPIGALARLRWDPGDYAVVDVAPMYRFSRTFAVGLTAGYYTQGRDRYAFLSPQDSTSLATRLGGPVSAGVLDAGTAQRHARLGLAMSYVGPTLEGGFSVERTVSGAGGPAPVATMFRVVMRQTIQLF